MSSRALRALPFAVAITGACGNKPGTLDLFPSGVGGAAVTTGMTGAGAATNTNSGGSTAQPGVGGIAGSMPGTGGGGFSATGGGGGTSEPDAGATAGAGGPPASEAGGADSGSAGDDGAGSDDGASGEPGNDCVAPDCCRSRGDCPAALPACVDEKCVACETSTDCNDEAPVCSTATHDCGPCTSDAQCSDGLSCGAEGECETQAQ